MTVLNLPGSAPGHAAGHAAQLHAAQARKESAQADRLIRMTELMLITGLGRSTIYELMRGDFPANVRIGRRAVAWRLSSVMAWLESRPVGGAHSGE